MLNSTSVCNQWKQSFINTNLSKNNKQIVFYDDYVLFGKIV